MLIMKSKIKRFNIMRGKAEIEKQCFNLPDQNEVYKFMSTGGFSSICFIKFVADITRINRLDISTLRVGKKELQMLDYLYKKGKLGKCNFIIGSLMANDSKLVKSYNYYNDFKKVCENNEWGYKAINNHSKILLFDTEIGKYVIETSSNLNENPKIEQFSFEKDERLYDFYFENLFVRCEGKWN